jgi:large subunit ribosomal protein L10
MKREQKAQTIDKLQDEISKSTIGILTDYRGLKTPELNGLRRKLQDAGGDYEVVKNTLAIKALGKLNLPGMDKLFSGPVAVAFGRGDVQDTARVVADYVRTTKITLPVKGGFMGDRLLTADDVSTLAILPAKNVLVARVIGGMKGPLYGLVGVLAAPMRNLQGVLQARIRQLEGAK